MYAYAAFRLPFRLFFIATLLGLNLIWGCADPADRPSYIAVPKAGLIYGSDTIYDIVKDVWVYQNVYQGTYQVPANFPILNPSIKNVVFGGGIWVNGDPGTHYRYPFWTLSTAKFALEPEQTYTHTPYFRYITDTVFQVCFLENFEDNDTKFQNLDLPDLTSIERSSEQHFRGKRCGKIVFDGVKDSMMVESITSFTVPKNITDCWIEVAYRGDIRIGAALEFTQSDGISGPATGLLYPQEPYGNERWQFACFSITNAIKSVQDNCTFKLNLLVYSDGEPHTLYIDEVRVLYLKPL